MVKMVQKQIGIRILFMNVLYILENGQRMSRSELRMMMWGHRFIFVVLCMVTW